MKSAKPKLDREQRSALTARVEMAYRSKKYNGPKTPRPPGLAEARRLIRRYERRRDALSARHSSKVANARAKVLETMMFGSAEASLKAVKKFERTRFR